MKISKVFGLPMRAQTAEPPVAPSLIAEGAMVMTPTGAVPIQDLRQGDRIITYDRGTTVVNRRLKVLGSTLSPAWGPLAPVDIDFHGERSTCVSPSTLVMVRSPYCELYYGSPVALVRATSLRNDCPAPVSDPTERSFVALYLEQPGLIDVNGMLFETTSPPETVQGSKVAGAPFSGLMILSEDEARLLYECSGGASNVVVNVNER